MGRLLLDPFGVGFMQRALLEVVLLAVLGGVVGTHVLLRRLAFTTEAFQHTIFPGVAIAFAAGQSLLLGALVAAAVSVVLLTALTRQPRIDPDAALALLIATFLAVGVAVVSRSRSFQGDLTALLFGRILTVDARQLVHTAVIVTVCVVGLFALHKELVMRAFDPVGTGAVGYRVWFLDLVLNVAVALSVVAAVRAVGSVLLVAFLVTPAAAARLCCRRVGSMMAVATGLAAVCGWLGLAASYEASVNHGVRLASGATVVLAITAGFLVVAAGTGIRTAAGRG